MMKLVQHLIQEVVKSGIGQAILAFGAWAYVLILLLVAAYYAFMRIIKK